MIEQRQKIGNFVLRWSIFATPVTFNLTCAVSYGTYDTHIVIYIPKLAINEEDTALYCGLCEASGLIKHFMTCMLRVI